MITEFDPAQYMNEGDEFPTINDFNEYWDKNNRDGKIEQKGEDWDSVLLNKGGKWYLIDSGNLETILDANDSTSEEHKEELLNNPSIGKYDISGVKSIKISNEEEFKTTLKDLADKGYKWISNHKIDDSSIYDTIQHIKKYEGFPHYIVTDLPNYNFKNVGHQPKPYKLG